MMKRFIWDGGMLLPRSHRTIVTHRGDRPRSMWSMMMLSSSSPTAARSVTALSSPGASSSPSSWSSSSSSHDPTSPPRDGYPERTSHAPSLSLSSVSSLSIRRGLTTITTLPSSSKEYGATLFGLPNLRSPNEFVRLANNAIRDCDAIRSKLATSLSNSSSTSSSSSHDNAVAKAKSTLRLIDDISNIVCTVIDAAELCRSVHYSPRWRRAATDAFGILSEYIGSLNADASIYMSLRRFVFADDRGDEYDGRTGISTTHSALLLELPREYQRMAMAMRREFERDGIHLSYNKREEAREMNNIIVGLESLFTSNITEKVKYFDVSGTEMISMVDDIVPRHVLGQLVRRQTAISPNHRSDASSNADDDAGRLTLSSDALLCNTLLAHSPSSALRKEVYVQSHTSVPENLGVLDSLIRYRHLHSSLLGYRSYAHRVLSDRMVLSPENAMAFLNEMERRGKDVFRRDMDAITHVKRKMEGGYGDVEPWDVPYYTSLVKAQRQFVRWKEDDAGGTTGADEDGDDFDEYSQFVGYFTVENSIEGMKVLVRELFGITMREVNIPIEERWDVDNDASDSGSSSSTGDYNGGGGRGLRKFVFHHEVDGILGTMYFDLHPREGKFLHAAHFTIRCGRMRNDEDVDEEGRWGGRDNDGGVQWEDKGDHQLPIVALVCNLSPSSQSSASMAQLSHSEVETLYHEFGHGLHSLLSRTSFQHLSGTRASMDFVETPSHLLEAFARDPGFLSQVLARHYVTGRPMSVRKARHLALSHLDFRGLEVQTQIVHSKFDQALFGPNPCTTSLGGCTSTEMFERLHREAGVPFASGTHWHSRFGHLVTYGAGYYGYLYSQTFAADIWTSTLASSSTSSDLRREGGTKIWKEMLIHGGARDPKEMIHAVLGREPSVDPFFNGMS
ncbi:hypothetical protein ACHAXA_008597 [Cyclostephanos tholiformis]|uniref:Peptidase M3A/M3B catalytic domain-containing protein n=1 Tax=Cyclostephanos tholiformis TaxID=382380 RepID=A0ABD3SP68_9STRA